MTKKICFLVPVTFLNTSTFRLNFSAYCLSIKNGFSVSLISQSVIASSSRSKSKSTCAPRIFDAFLGKVSEHKTFYHGHTYTGNALGCAAALASLELFEENKILESLPGKISLIDKTFDQLAGLDYVGDVRHRGLMGGIELVKDKQSKEPFPHEKQIGAKLCSAMRPKGAMMRPLGDVIVVMPPIAIDIELLRELLGIVKDSIENDLPRILEEI